MFAIWPGGDVFHANRFLFYSTIEVLTIRTDITESSSSQVRSDEKRYNNQGLLRGVFMTTIFPTRPRVARQNSMIICSLYALCLGWSSRPGCVRSTHSASTALAEPTVPACLLDCRQLATAVTGLCVCLLVLLRVARSGYSLFHCIWSPISAPCSTV